MGRHFRAKKGDKRASQQGNERKVCVKVKVDNVGFGWRRLSAKIEQKRIVYKEKKRKIGTAVRREREDVKEGVRISGAADLLNLYTSRCAKLSPSVTFLLALHTLPTRPCLPIWDKG
jgi:hypothetical protein